MNNVVNRALVAKKPSFKTTTLIAAIGTIAYSLYILIHYAIHELCSLPPYRFDLWDDICVRLIYDILPVSFIFAGIGLLKYRPSNASSKLFRIFTTCLFGAITATLVFSNLYSVQISSLAYIYPPIYWRAIMLISGIVWLFMLMRQPLEEASPRSYRVTLIIAIVALALPIVLEMISGISLALGGEIFCFNSYAIKPWVKWIAPVMVLAHFVFPQIKDINTTRNSHCMPGCFNEKTYKVMRIATITSIGLTLLSFLLCITLSRISRDILSRYDVYLHWANDTAMVLAYGTLLGVLISWIMLSIMAFCHLPNPLGYKIYNILAQIITWGTFVASIVINGYIGEVFASISLFAFISYILTQTIRVMSYSFPKPLEQ